MINDRIFTAGFRFTTFTYKKFKRNNLRAGAKKHYVAFLARGRAKITTGNSSLDIKEGDVFYIPKGLCYESFWYGDPTVELFSLGFELMPSFHKEEYPLQAVDADGEHVKIITELAKSGADSPKKIGALYSLLGEIIPKMEIAGSDEKSEFVAMVKKYVSAHPKENVSEVAKKFAVSESGLYLAFKKHSDKSINEYRSCAVMNEAAELLTSTDTPIEQISDSLGFSSSSYFRKRFKAHFGICPRDMRKKNGI